MFILPQPEGSHTSGNGRAQRSTGMALAAVSQARTRRQRLISGIVVGMLAVVLLSGMAYAIAAAAATTPPRQLAATLCANIKSGNYAAVYDLLSAVQRYHTYRDKIAVLGKVRDLHAGKVRDCGNVSHLQMAEDQASLTMEIVRNTKTSGALLLVREEGDWKLDNIQGDLQVL
jgi:hypothetical protein